MASLAEQLLDDLEEEEDVEEEKAEEDVKREGGVVEEESVDENGEEDEEDSRGLLASEKFKDVLRAVDGGDGEGMLEEKSNQDKVMECVRMAAKVDEEVTRLFQELRNQYAPKFPELETLIFNPLDYARVVNKARNESDLTKVDLASVLPSATVITVTVTASATSGVPLGEAQLKGVLKLADEILALDVAKSKLLGYVESQTSTMAPNLSALLGTAVAAQLIGVAGSVMELAMIPACNIQALGAKKRTRSMPTRQENPNVGAVFQCDLVQRCAPDLQMKACRTVCAKTALAARVDASHSAEDGSIGRTLNGEIQKKIEKWQEPPPAKTAKPLPVPDEKPRKKRGGRRHRKQKELYAMSEMQKQQNRMAFGRAEETYGVDDEEVGLGMLGAEGSKKLRVQAKKTDSVAKAANRKLSQIKQRGGSGARAAGLTTTLTFTAEQGGFELGAKTPMPGGSVQGIDAADGTKSNYFSAGTPFLGSDARR